MATIRREQLAAVNINYRMYPFQDFLDTQRELGMKTIELWAGAPHFLMDYQQRPDCAALRAEIESRELRVAALTPESALYQFPVAAYNEEVQKLAIPYYTNALKSAQELGAAGMPINCAGGLKTEDPEAVFQRAVDTLKKLAPIAQELGVVIAVETMPSADSVIINTLPQLQKLLAAVDHPFVKATLDVCAVRCAGETLEQWFQALGEKIVHIHFTDGRPGGRLVWGQGLHPLDTYLETLEKYGYKGCLGLNTNLRGMWFDSSLLDEEGRFSGRDFYPENYWFYPPAADRKNLEQFIPYLED